MLDRREGCPVLGNPRTHATVQGVDGLLPVDPCKAKARRPLQKRRQSGHGLLINRKKISPVITANSRMLSLIHIFSYVIFIRQDNRINYINIFKEKKNTN